MSNQTLPSPPVLKTTIIHLNKDMTSNQDNYELLTNDYSQRDDKSSDSVDSSNVIDCFNGQKRKRRKSSNTLDSDSMESRKSKAKQVHSVIEKRRRTKINREFEALKYLIPACRSVTPTGTSKQASQGSNNSRIDGMYKLTILKSSVEYILYLHHIIQKQHHLLKGNDKYNFDINFSEVPLDVNEYRDIDKDFNFKRLATSFNSTSSFSQRKSETFPQMHEESEEYCSTSAPSPDITPNNEFESASTGSLTTKTPNLQSMFSDPIFHSKNVSMKAPLSSGISPLTPGLSSTVSSNFFLPAPAIKLPDIENASDNIPRQKKADNSEFQEGKNPGGISPDGNISDKDISRMLLSLRKSSIDNLLN